MDEILEHFEKREPALAFGKYFVYSFVISALSLTIPFLDLLWGRIAP